MSEKQLKRFPFSLQNVYRGTLSVFYTCYKGLKRSFQNDQDKRRKNKHIIENRNSTVSRNGVWARERERDDTTSRDTRHGENNAESNTPIEKVEDSFYSLGVRVENSRAQLER